MAWLGLIGLGDDVFCNWLFPSPGRRTSLKKDRRDGTAAMRDGHGHLVGWRVPARFQVREAGMARSRGSAGSLWLCRMARWLAVPMAAATVTGMLASPAGAAVTEAAPYRPGGLGTQPPL